MGMNSRPSKYSSDLQFLQAFAPVVYLYPDDVSAPCSVDWFLPQMTLTDATGAPHPWTSTSVQDIFNQVADTSLGSHSGWTLQPPADAAKAALVKSGNLSTARCYGYVRYTDQGYIDLNYCFFYPFNGDIVGNVDRVKLAAIGGYFAAAMPILLTVAAPFAAGVTAYVTGQLLSWGGAGMHWGDWEGITVRLVSPYESISKGKVFYNQHSKGEWVSSPPLTSDNRPIVYSATDSHASYPTTGVQVRTGGLLDDVTSSAGPQWDTSGCMVDVGHDPNARNAYVQTSSGITEYSDGAPTSVAVNDNGDVCVIAGGQLYYSVYTPGGNCSAPVALSTPEGLANLAGWNVALNNDRLVLLTGGDSRNTYSIDYALGVLSNPAGSPGSVVVTWLPLNGTQQVGTTGTQIKPPGGATSIWCSGALGDIDSRTGTATAVFVCQCTGPKSPKADRFCVVGQLSDWGSTAQPATVSWGTPIKYDNGSGLPYCAMNTRGQWVEVHADADDGDLWFNLGMVQKGGLTANGPTKILSNVNKANAVSVSMNNSGDVACAFLDGTDVKLMVGEIQTGQSTASQLAVTGWPTTLVSLDNWFASVLIGLRDDQEIVLAVHGSDDPYGSPAAFGLIGGDTGSFDAWTPNTDPVTHLAQTWMKYGGLWGPQGTAPPFADIKDFRQFGPGPSGPAYKNTWLVGPG